MKSLRCIAAIAVVSLPLLLSVAGCCSSDPSKGYSMTSMYRENITTVAVPMWERGANVYRRDLEFRLTEAIQKRIELDTPYKVVDKSRADTLLEGKIVEVDQRVLSFNPDNGQPRDIQIRITVDFTWIDLRTGEVLVKQNNLRGSGVYYFPEPFNEDFFEGSADAINRLAERIVESMEKPW